MIMLHNFAIMLHDLREVIDYSLCLRVYLRTLLSANGLPCMRLNGNKEKIYLFLPNEQL